ncbi:MAG: NAD(P)/FAD-dependent oxidoreductase [Leptothrix ochracea]|uniref:NAD(P)/FAD-dependent oxidoreductase n=1 Tax=Leptothrix ochracea TaxID=735331 RepID=UPI0034E2999D
MKRIAVIGSGIAGLSAAWHLSQAGQDGLVTLFEAESHFGGHAHTVDVTLPDDQGTPVRQGVDTGFLVFNHRTYPLLRQLFVDLEVATAPAEMSFSVQSRSPHRPALEWSGNNLDSVFAQRRNLLRPKFWGMLADILRFNRLTTRLAQQAEQAQQGEALDLDVSVGAFLDQHRFSTAFRNDYLLPMVACIWSCPTEQMLAFPIATLIRFCHNHGLLQVTHRPQWYTVRGGSRQYVQRMLKGIHQTRANTPIRQIVRHGTGSGITVITAAGHSEHFDAVVLACHSDQALQMLGDQASAQERAVLGAVRYQRNHAVLHTDTALLPERRNVWAAWNYEHSPTPGSSAAPQVCLHYLINRLQPLPFAQPVIVSLNPVREPAASTVLARFDYAHPVFDRAAIHAQAQVAHLQGQHATWFCGAWTGYGFHEDGLRSGRDAAEHLLRPAQATQG